MYWTVYYSASHELSKHCVIILEISKYQGVPLVQSAPSSPRNPLKQKHYDLGVQIALFIDYTGVWGRFLISVRA